MISKKMVSASKALSVEQLSGGICICVTQAGEVIMKGFGDLDKDIAEQVARQLVLLAARLKNAARNGQCSYLLH